MRPIDRQPDQGRQNSVRPHFVGEIFRPTANQRLDAGTPTVPAGSPRWTLTHGFRRSLRQTTYIKQMKKFVIIAVAAIVTTLGATYAANALRDHRDCGKCETGNRCGVCNGTGWKGQFKCFTCKGTGASNSY